MKLPTAAGSSSTSEASLVQIISLHAAKWLMQEGENSFIDLISPRMRGKESLLPAPLL